MTDEGIDFEEVVACEHEGVECETQVVCTADCTCKDCLEVINAPFIAGKDTSDGHHTFRDLYEHRMALTLALAHSGAGRVWRSKQHHPDDSTPMFEGDFIVGIELPSGQILYHYKLEHWDKFEGIHEVNTAPKWDGAGPEETIKRLMTYRAGWKV
jgi:hypothetical protein